jgi:hypothetical protein
VEWSGSIPLFRAFDLERGAQEKVYSSYGAIPFKKSRLLLPAPAGGGRLFSPKFFAPVVSLPPCSPVLPAPAALLLLGEPSSGMAEEGAQPGEAPPRRNLAACCRSEWTGARPQRDG